MEKCTLCTMDADLCECDDQPSYTPVPPERRRDFAIYNSYAEPANTETQYVSVYFPGVGNLTITFENRTLNTDDVNRDDRNNYRPVLSFDFNTANVDIIDDRGNDREIHLYHNDHQELNNS